MPFTMAHCAGVAKLASVHCLMTRIPWVGEEREAAVRRAAGSVETPARVAVDSNTEGGGASKTLGYMGG